MDKYSLFGWMPWTTTLVSVLFLFTCCTAVMCIRVHGLAFLQFALVFVFMLSWVCSDICKSSCCVWLLVGHLLFANALQYMEVLGVSAGLNSFCTSFANNLNNSIYVDPFKKKSFLVRGLSQSYCVSAWRLCLLLGEWWYTDSWLQWISVILYTLFVVKSLVFIVAWLCEMVPLC